MGQNVQKFSQIVCMCGSNPRFVISISIEIRESCSVFKVEMSGVY